MGIRVACLAVLAGGSIVSAAALASKDETIAFPEPQPGGTVSGASQDIGTSKGMTVTAKGDLRGTTVATEGGVKGKWSETAGNAVAACWLAGPQAVTVNHEKVREWLRSDDLQDFAREESVDPYKMLNFCVALVTFIGERLSDTPSARASAACRATPVNLRFRRRDGRTVLTQAKRRQGPNTRFSCRTVNGGIALTARDRKGRPLKRSLGSKLDYKLYKTTKGPPSDGKLSLRFQLR